MWYVKFVCFFLFLFFQFFFLFRSRNFLRFGFLSLHWVRCYRSTSYHRISITFFLFIVTKKLNLKLNLLLYAITMNRREKKSSYILIVCAFSYFCFNLSVGLTHYAHKEKKKKRTNTENILHRYLVRYTYTMTHKNNTRTHCAHLYQHIELMNMSRMCKCGASEHGCSDGVQYLSILM